MHEFGKRLQEDQQDKQDKQPEYYIPVWIHDPVAPDKYIQVSIQRPPQLQKLPKLPLPRPAEGFKQWWCSFSACPNCIANAEAGQLPTGNVFPSGVTEPPAHYQCYCTMIVNAKNDPFYINYPSRDEIEREMKKGGWNV